MINRVIRFCLSDDPPFRRRQYSLNICGPNIDSKQQLTHSCIVVADSSKVGQVHFVHLAALSDLEMLAVDRRAPTESSKTLAQLAVELANA